MRKRAVSLAVALLVCAPIFFAAVAEDVIAGEFHGHRYELHYERITWMEAKAK